MCWCKKSWCEKRAIALYSDSVIGVIFDLESVQVHLKAASVNTRSMEKFSQKMTNLKREMITPDVT